MFIINKLRADHVIDYAAEEMKKYLRMMMPECDEVEIRLDPAAAEGFRLGFLQDFGLPNEAEDPVLDDIIHIDTFPEGGILAGSNSRSVLFAVYRFFRENGCRWLYPGVDGDYVPMQDIVGVQYHKAADHRFRGFCNEGAESQTCMLEAADYYAKLEMNVYMLEWFIPNGYYNRYYTHIHNPHRIPEPVSDRQVLQWKRQCEAEISKRGLMFHDIGHGWTSRPFGMPCNNSVDNNFEGLELTEAQRSVLALRNGSREVFQKAPLYTNVCMSQPGIRTAIAKEVAQYAASHRNIDYLHVWLSDGANNHCECEECVKLRPSDWYMMIMNEIDRELTQLGLDTRIVFICYTDTMFAPQQITIDNPKRFSLLYAPIARSYNDSVETLDGVPEADPYVRNKWSYPKTSMESFAHLQAWRKTWKGPVFSYEYHFWRHQFLDPGGLALARRLYEDVRSLRVMNLDGYVEDGSQRSGFPNAFPVYIYAETLMNRDCDYDAVAADYFSHIYGEDWKTALKLLQQISEAFDFAYMESQCCEDPQRSPHYAPSRVGRLSRIFELAARERAVVSTHLNMPYRPQTVSWRLLLRHGEYIEMWARIMIEKAQGNDYRAAELAKEFADTFSKYELEIERYYDHALACRTLTHITSNMRGIILE